MSRQWEREFDILCTLLAHSAVVHADETSWSINSVWAFLSEKVRVLFFGMHKDAATLEQIFNPATFAGIVVSDDAAVYANLNRAQKCWAHLLRKAIKLTLLEPDDAEYREFTDRLLEIYRAAGRVQRDRRLSDAGRARKVDELDEELLELCGPVWSAELPPTDGRQNDYRLLVNELMRLMLARELVTSSPRRRRKRPTAKRSRSAERTTKPSARSARPPRPARPAAPARRRRERVVGR